MNVNIEELEVGDEILISCQSYFKYLRVLRKPEIGKRKHWSTGAPTYKSVRCSTRRDTITKSYTYSGKTKTWEQHKFIVTPDDHNYEQYVELGYRGIWLLNRKI